MSATVFYNSASELATLSNTFSVNGVATDPTAITLTVTSPAGVITSYTGGQFTHTPASGLYSVDVACTEAGVWLYLWVGTGVASDAVAGTWTVHSVVLNRLYCTPAELKSRIGIADALDDDQILAACEATSRWIDGHCERQFWRGTDTRTFYPSTSTWADLDDLVSATTVKTDTAGDGTFATTLTASTYQLLPLNPGYGPEARPYTRLKLISGGSFPTGGYRTDVLQIVGVYGWPAVPDAVKHAAAIMAGDFLKLGSMAFGVQGYGDYGPVRARMSGPAVALLAPYRRNVMLLA